MWGLQNLQRLSNMKKLLGMLLVFLGFSTDTYGTELEKYIVGRNPKDAGDVERLTYEFHRKQSNWKFL